MYYYLRGQIIEVYNDSLIIDVSGIGYQVLMSHPETYSSGDNALVYISQIVREDEQYFVGFSSLREKDLFNKLINCKGIGPRTALNALRDISLDDFICAIQTNDIKRLKKLSGIGPKAAAQIILDLQGVLTFDSTESIKEYNEAQLDAKQALKQLGFKVKDIDACLNKIEDKTLSCEEYITIVLRNIRKG